LPAATNDVVAVATLVHPGWRRATGSAAFHRAQSGLIKPVPVATGDRRPTVLRITYADVKFRHDEERREAARRRLIDSTASRQPGIWRFPRALSLRFAALRPAI
jgi:hypothetical protein